jgi:vancomycin resistance protein VanW
MKYMKLRLLMDDWKSFWHGWYFRMSNQKAQAEEEGLGWRCLADFSTTIRIRDSLREINANRIHNMSLGCAKIDQIVLEPGEVFSLRRVLGNPTADKGFREGPMIIAGRLGFTSGGGLCQVSTTLFNAVLLANLKILEKHNHSIDIWCEERLIDLGRDAVFIYARKDLKFKNTHEDKILIRMRAVEAERIVNCQIYSPTALKVQVNLETKILKNLHFKANRKQKSRIGQLEIPGWIVQTTRKVIGENLHETANFRKKERYKPGIVLNNE